MAAPSKYAGLAATWDLQTDKAPPTDTIVTLQGGEDRESVIGLDHRYKVDHNVFKDGGKYRSIVKLKIAYEGMSPEAEMACMGTGWLISPDILVTAGHCVYDHSGLDGQGFGRAKTIQCHIGYDGRDSLNDRSVQTRFAKRVVTTGEWIDSRDNRNRDIAFLQLEMPFTGNIRPFQFASTPVNGDEKIGVIGYPGDESLMNGDGFDENGAQMHEDFQDIRYSQEDHPLKMLEYHISTFGGQSGAPVLSKQINNVSIGTHCYNGGDKNSASPIGGKYANNYAAYISAFNAPYPVVTSTAGINFVNPHAPSNDTMDPSISSNDVDVKGFLDSFKSVIGAVAKVGSAIIPAASPMLGPLGGPISAVAGAALSAAVEATSAESAIMANSQAYKGATERAVLAEATLQSVLNIKDPDLSLRVMQDMEATYSKSAPHITNIAPKMTPLLKDSALRIAVNQDYMRKSSDVKLGSPRAIREDSESKPGADESHSQFAECLLGEARPVNGEEGFFDGLGSFFGKALSMAKPLTGSAAKTALERLNNALASSSDSEFETLAVDKEDLHAATLLTQRAVIAEAALQAVMKLPRPELALVSNSETESLFGTESFFDGIKSTAQVIGSAVSKVAPKVISSFSPVVAEALDKKVAAS